MNIFVRPGNIEEAADLQAQIPEFAGAYSVMDYRHRLRGENVAIFIAEVDGQIAGFKVGYDRFMDGEVFYSWIGGVLVQYRGKGVAVQLLKKMELWCKIKGFKFLKFKTLNKHRSMIRFAVSQGFNIVDFMSDEDPEKSSVFFQKAL